MEELKHRHHLLPRHRGGTDADGIIELTPVQHAMFHFCEWKLHGLKEDWLAWKGLTGCIGKEELRRLAVSAHNTNRSQEERDLISSRTRVAMDSEEVREKIRESNRRRKGEKRDYNNPRAKEYIGTSPDGVEYEFRGLRKFAEENGLKHQGISCVLRGAQKKHKGWTFRYK
ncbi:HNHc domain containing protein [Synechococcus phage MA10]